MWLKHLAYTSMIHVKVMITLEITLTGKELNTVSKYHILDREPTSVYRALDWHSNGYRFDSDHNQAYFSGKKYGLKIAPQPSVSLTNFHNETY